MDIISRMIQFPSMFRSIDLAAIFNQLVIYPFFNLLYILHSLKYQVDLIEQDQEYYPPVLCNDSVYTWYRMGLLAKSAKDAELDEQFRVETELLAEEKANKIQASDRIDNVIDINYKEKRKAEEITSIDSVEDKIPVSDKNINRTNQRIRINSVSLFHKNSIYKFVKQEHVVEIDETIELSGFAKFLRSKTKIKEQTEDLISDENVAPVDENRGESTITFEADQADNETDIATDKKKKKKEKKHKKKELVNQLVEQSVHDNELLVSEPFAELLYAQGYKDKAIKIYEKLMEKNPEKRLSFAAKIDKINKESF